MIIESELQLIGNTLFQLFFPITAFLNRVPIQTKY